MVFRLFALRDACVLRRGQRIFTMKDMKTGEITCDVCLKPITEGGYVLSSPEPGLHPIKTVHDGKCIEKSTPFHELTVKTRIADAHL